MLNRIIAFSSIIMPHHCIVPLCNNHSGTPGISFHRLPLKDPDLLKQWLIKIRRENTPINEYSRVCSEHFEGGKRKGRKDIPSVFAWTKSGGRPPPKNRILQVEAVSRSEPILFPSASSQPEHILEGM